MPRPTEAHDLDDADEALLEIMRRLREHDYRFVTPTPATHARVNARSENAVAADEAGVFGWSRPFRPDLLGPELLDRMRRAGIVQEGSGGLLRSTVRVSWLSGELFVHSAFPTLEPDAVFFGPDTYRFANALAAWLTPERAAGIRRAVDIGCGAGPGAILVARAAPAAEVVMADINEAALARARVNARAAGTGNAAARRSDLLSGVDGDFDLVVSNPPYLNDPLRRAYRHGGGEFGAGLSQAIVESALARLSPGGTLVLYTGVAVLKGRDPFAAWLAERLGGEGVWWSYREVDPDVFGEELESDAYRGAERIAAVVLTLRTRT